MGNFDNYPPGLTGAEEEIAGRPYRMKRRRRCRHCGGGHVDLERHEENCVMRETSGNRTTENSDG